MIELLGEYGEGPEVENVMNGTFVPPADTSTATKDFLSACTKHKGAGLLSREQNTVGRYRTNKRSWKVRRETTSTGGKHIGHFQAAMKHKYLTWMIFQRGDIPAVSGYSPKRHRTCVDLMILKKAQSFELKTQRTLGILDTEFNNNNGFIGRMASNNGLKLNTIAGEQFARPGRSALEEVIAKRCVIDHQQSTRQCFALTSCDLAGCYDRIVHMAAYLALRQLGVPKVMVISLLQTVQYISTIW